MEERKKKNWLQAHMAHAGLEQETNGRLLHPHITTTIMKCRRAPCAAEPCNPIFIFAYVLVDQSRVLVVSDLEGSEIVPASFCWDLRVK
jgi:hypothetical protein